MLARATAAAALVGALFAGATDARAQDEAGRPLALSVTVHAGGTAFTRMQNITVEAAGLLQPSYPGEIAASTAASLGADMTLWFRPWLGARLHFLYAPSNFELRLTEEDREEVLGAASSYESLDYSNLSLFTLTGSVMLALPIRSAHVAPYALLGLGAAHFSADERGAQGLDAAFDGRSTATQAVAVAGMGLKIPLNAGRVSLSFEISDHVMRTPIPEHDDRVLLDTGTLRAINQQHPMAAEDDARYMHSVGIAAGLSFATGGPTPPDLIAR